MLKRNGERCECPVPGFKGKLTPAEMDAYNAAFAVIQREFEALERVKEHLKDMRDNPVLFTIPQEHVAGGTIEIPNTPVDRWQIRSTLLGLPNSETFLCERCIGGRSEFAAVERFRANSPYAQANGGADELLRNDDSVRLVEDYNRMSQHTLRFIASNLVAKAHKVVWERFSSFNPVRVVQAISERCAEAASLEQSEGQAQAVHQGRSQSETVGNRV